jgi:hypothetical protein
VNDLDKDQFEEIEPPAWALAAASTLEKAEEHVPPTAPNISVVAGRHPAKPAPPRGAAVEVQSETETVVDQIACFIERFVFLKTKSLYRLLALWTIETHMYPEFEYTGYIFAYSPEPQSGKSRLLEILELLVANPSGILISPSEAVLFRTADGHTQLLDEVDGWTNREFLRSVLNAGFRRGATVKRIEDGGNGFEVGSFPVFAPRALAGIGSKILDGTTRDRTFQFEMVRQLRDERRDKFRARTAGPEARLITSEVAKWIDESRHRVAEIYKRADFPYLQEFRDRTIDVTEPLAAILEVVYGKSPRLEQARADLLEAISLTRKDQASLPEDHRILETLAKLAESEEPLVGNATELAARCAPELGENAESLDVSSVLRRYGFETKSIRKGGEAKYRYSLPHDALSELLKRYGRAQKPSDEDQETAVVAVVSVVGEVGGEGQAL